MRSGVIDKVLEPLFKIREPKISGCPGNLSKERLINSVKSGTTLCSFKYQDGIVLASDRKTTSGFDIVSQATVKIVELDNYNAFMGAGACSNIDLFKQKAIEVGQFFIDRYGILPSVLGRSNFLARFLTDFRLYVSEWALYEFIAIVSGMDLDDKSFHTVIIDSDGYVRESDYHYAGSGGDGPRHVLWDHRSKISDRSLNLKQSMSLAAKVMLRSGAFDIGSSDMRVAYPNMAIITEDGFRFLPDKMVASVCNKIINADGGRKNG